MFIPSSAFIAIDILICIILLLNIYFGYKKGLIYQVLSLVSFLGAAILALIFGPILAEKYIIIQAGSNITDIVMASVFNQVAWFIIVLIIGKILFDIILQLSKALSKLPLIGFVNKVLGAVFGLFNGVIWVILLSTLFMTPIFENGAEIRQNTLLNKVDTFSNMIVLFINENIDFETILDKEDFNIKIEDIDGLRNDVKDWLKEEGILE